MIIKKNILKKIVDVAMPCLAIIIYFTLLSFSSVKLNEKFYQNIKIQINPEHLKFTKVDDVWSYIKTKKDKTPVFLSYNNLYKTAKKLHTNPWIQDIHVYPIGVDELILECNQRRPFFRIQNMEGQHLYVDSLGFLFPAVNDFACNVPFAGGFLHENYNRHKELNIKHQIEKDTPLSNIFHTADIWKVLNEIGKDSLLMMMMKNIYIEKSGEIILIPSVGKHKVILGKTDRLDYKLKKLSIFYKEAYLKSPLALNYSKINLKFKNQIVCTTK